MQIVAIPHKAVSTETFSPACEGPLEVEGSSQGHWTCSCDLGDVSPSIDVQILDMKDKEKAIYLHLEQPK